MISNRGLGSPSEYLSATYSCSPDRDSILAPSQQRVEDRKVSTGERESRANTYCIAGCRGADSVSLCFHHQRGDVLVWQ